MKNIVETVAIHKNIETVFTCVTDVSQITTLSKHIIEVVYSPAGSNRYRQVRLVHGRRQIETVEIITLKPHSRYTVRMSAFGIATRYDYSFEMVNLETTRIDLIKSIQATGISKLLLPLAYHIATRPEHDGNHLQVLKEAIEKSEFTV